MTYISVSQFAEMRGCSRQNVLKKIKRGTLKAKRVGHAWIIKLSKMV
mgnify:CR=1